MKSLLSFKRDGSFGYLIAAILLVIAYPESSGMSQQLDDDTEILRFYVPPLQKGGTGGFLPLDIAISTQNKPPSVPLFQRGKKTLHKSESGNDHVAHDASSAHSLCIKVTQDTGIERHVPVGLDSMLRLSFQHSIYASRVEEIFRVTPGGFQLTELRYAEPRLAGFYGHDNAKYENGFWVVKPAQVLLPSLNLRVSADATMSLSFSAQSNSSELIVPFDSAVRLTTAPCKDTRDG